MCMYAGIKKKTSVMSFRLDQDTVEALREEAEEEEVSLNVLANHVFRRYVEWERFAQKAGFIPITKELLTALLNEVNQEKIEELVKKIGKEVIKAQILYMENKYDLDSFIKWSEARNRISGFAHKRVRDGDNHEYIIQHDLNFNWSLYMKTIYEMVLEDVYKKKVEFELTPSTVVFRLEH
ncbi:MAG: hypothetical protein ACE5J2_02245 [Nitrososphaerales archaeon]